MSALTTTRPCAHTLTGQSPSRAVAIFDGNEHLALWLADDGGFAEQIRRVIPLHGWRRLDGCACFPFSWWIDAEYASIVFRWAVFNFTVETSTLREGVAR